MSASGGGQRPYEGYNIVKTGYMKKVKTGRRKWFVLRNETPEAQARLEYYDSEKKYQGGAAPRKVILLKTCFNINQINNSKHKNVIALYTKDECLSLGIEDDAEADAWFKDLLLLQQGEDLPEGQVPRPTFAHVWDVVLVNRGLGTPDLIGNYRLCLKEKTLSLIRRECDFPQLEVNLSNIRSCGSLQKYVFLELGRGSPLGSGELWMETEDQNIAQNVHSTVYHAMTKCGNRDDLAPLSRIRSSSATETSKTNNTKKQYTKSHIFSQGITSSGRERCDSMPSRARTASEGNQPIHMFPSSRSYLAPYRPYSVHRDLGSSPPVGSPISPPSAGASTDSAGSSYSLVDENEDLDSNHGRYSHSLTPDEAIAEEDCDSLCAPYGISPNTGNYLPMAPPSSDDGYVAMSPLGVQGNITPAASLSSVTSGTPSTDLRFAEYQLDKVMCFFPPSSDDESRPIRAYSVGSRPETQKYKKPLMDVHGLAESRRDRAASVGSKTKKGPIRVLPPHGHYPHTHPKSSSAPILSTSRIPGSTSSVGSEMDDLMEMDFTNVKKRSLDGYLEMKPTPKHKNIMKPTAITSISTPVTTPSGYVEMKPGVTPPNSGPYLEMKPGTSPIRSNDYIVVEGARNPNSRFDYMDMNAKNKKPILTNNNNYSEYTEMNHHQPTIRRSYSQLSPSAGTYFKTTGSPNSDYLNMQPNNRARTNSDHSNEGYVEMTLGKAHHRQSSFDGVQGRMEEYAVMGMAPQSLRKKSNKKETTRSLPITISNSNQHSTNGPTYGRMYNDNSPKMQLPLTNTTSGYGSSLPRTRKNSSRRDSRDSSSSSVTTPSNSSTIFPLSLNSPSSPVKPLKTPDKPTPGLLNNLYKIIRKKNNGDSQQEDYAVMDFQKNNVKSVNHSADYVNCDFTNGGSSHEGDYADMQPGRISTNPDSNAFNLMTLTEASSRGFKPISEPCESTASPPLSSSSISTLPPVSPAGIRSGDSTKAAETDQTSKRPDTLNSEASNSKSVSRPGSASSDLCSSTSTLVGSRPDSVNSDSIRPASASLHYASLDLQVIDDDGDNRSPRTVRNNSNDSNQEVTFTYAEIDFNKSEGIVKGVRH